MLTWKKIKIICIIFGSKFLSSFSMSGIVSFLTRLRYSLWEKLYQVVRRPIPGPLTYWGPRQNCIAHFYSNQNIGNMLIMLSFANIATNAAVEESDHKFGFDYRKFSGGTFILPGQGTMYLLYPLLAGPGYRQTQTSNGSVVHSPWNNLFYNKHNHYLSTVGEIEVSPWIASVWPIFYPSRPLFGSWPILWEPHL